MKRNIIKLFIGVFVLVIVLMSLDVKTQAASKKWKKACNKYKTFLAHNESKFEAMEGDYETSNKENYKKSSYFLIDDLNADGVPELITLHTEAYKTDYLYIYTYKKGKVKSLKDSEGNIATIDISCSAAGYYTVSVCKKNHLHADWSGGDLGYNYSAYVMKKGKLKMYLNYIQDDLYDFTVITKYGKNINEKAYNKLISKCGRNYKFLNKNTSLNRTKYCK